MEKQITFFGCKHLIFDRSKVDNRIELHEIKGHGAFWHRPRYLALDGVADVQFCEKRGRLHGRLTCLKDFRECSDYEDFQHTVCVDKLEQ